MIGYSRTADLELALNWALGELFHLEPPDSRFVSAEFVSAAAISCDLASDDCRVILKTAIATEARRAETAKQGSVHEGAAIAHPLSPSTPSPKEDK